MTKSVSKDAFTLVEVMVAVMIISVVIVAIMQMYANNTHLLGAYKKDIKAKQYASFLISNSRYGFKSKSIHLNDLVEDFELERSLAKELKGKKVKVVYKELQSIDIAQEEKATYSGLVLEIGETILQTEETSTAFIRFKIR